MLIREYIDITNLTQGTNANINKVNTDNESDDKEVG